MPARARIRPGEPRSRPGETGINPGGSTRPAVSDGNPEPVEIVAARCSMAGSKSFWRRTAATLSSSNDAPPAAAAAREDLAGTIELPRARPTSSIGLLRPCRIPRSVAAVSGQFRLVEATNWIGSMAIVNRLSRVSEETDASAVTSEAAAGA